MLGAVATMMAAAGLLAAWKALPGLLIGRLITGVAVGLAAGTAIVYLIELRARANPGGSPIRAQTIGTAVTVGALGVGPLIAGCLAEWAGSPLTLPYLLFVALGAIALIGLAAAPETGIPAPAARGSGERFVTVRQGAGSRGLSDARGLRGERTLRRPVRAVPRNHASPSLTRALGRNAVRGVLLGRGSSAGDNRTAGVARARARHDLHAHRSRAAGDCGASIDTKPRAVSA